MTLDEVIKRYTDNAEYERTHGSLQGCLEFRQLAGWLKELKQLREQQPCEDCISRQEALSHKHIVYDDDGIGYSVVRVDEIMALSSVTPTRPTGKWIEKEDYNLDIYYDCSECGESFCLIDGTPTDYLYNYCPNCGARMAESEEEK